MAANVIDVENVVAGYVPEVNILNGCDLTVAAGEFVGIIGPNGAGKSTLLKAVLGLVNVRSGHVRLNGDEITGMKPYELVARGVGFVPQTRNVFPSLTVRENLEMGCFLRPDLLDERLEYAVEMFPRLGERLEQRAGSLTGVDGWRVEKAGLQRRAVVDRQFGKVGHRLGAAAGRRGALRVVGRHAGIDDGLGHRLAAAAAHRPRQTADTHCE